ncbi:MAG: hypothetical protein ACOCQQ_01550 [Candidatus Nanoarchaeia archaeon]
MNQDLYPKDFKAQQELKSCGFTPESINAIQSTKVITRDGAQHIVPQGQEHLDEKSSPVTNKTIICSSQDSNLLDQLQNHQKLFSRHKNYTDQRLLKLETALSAAQQTIKELHTTMMTMKSNQNASQERDRQFARAENTKEPSNKPIDRNKIAQSEVQVDKIFYCGTR